MSELGRQGVQRPGFLEGGRDVKWNGWLGWKGGNGKRYMAKCGRCVPMKSFDM